MAVPNQIALKINLARQKKNGAKLSVQLRNGVQARFNPEELDAIDRFILLASQVRSSIICADSRDSQGFLTEHHRNRHLLALGMTKRWYTARKPTKKEPRNKQTRSKSTAGRKVACR